MEPIYVKSGRQIYKLTIPRYKALLESLRSLKSFQFEVDELSFMIMLDLDMKNLSEEATFELRDVCV